MVTVQEAPIVNPPETTGTSANEEPKSSVADISQRANGAAALNDCVNDSQKESTGIEDRKSLILNRLKELEQETGEPEKRDVLRRRKKQLKDIDIFIKENAKSSEEVIEFLQQKLLAQFKEQTKLEAELIPLRLKVDRATKAKDEAQAEVLAKSSLNLKLQELARKLQQQNREMKEEDVMQRKLMIENFQRTLNDLKSRVDETNVKREESLNEKKAHLDMQNIMEQHYKAKVREMEVRLELADAKLRQAELTAMEHLHTAQIEAANFKEASRLLNDMGDKYRQFETTMKETSEAFKKTTEDSGKQERLIAKMDSLLAVRESDKQNLKRDLTRANAKIIQLASEAQTLRNQQAEEGSELERVRGQNSLLQKLARRLQQEVKALQSASADGAPAPGESAKTDSSNTCPTSKPAHELRGPEADVSESAAE